MNEDSERRLGDLAWALAFIAGGWIIVGNRINGYWVIGGGLVTLFGLWLLLRWTLDLMDRRGL